MTADSRDGEPTPGSWQVIPPGQAEHRWVIGDSLGDSIASCEPMGPWMSAATADANARLIAAAPDLEAELEYIVSYFDINIIPLDLWEWKQRAIAALKKAKGRA